MCFYELRDEEYEKTKPLDPFNDTYKDEDAVPSSIVVVYQHKREKITLDQQAEQENVFFSTQDERTDAPLQGERLCHYVTWFIIGLAILIVTYIVFFFYLYENKGNDNADTFYWEVTALACYAFSFLRTLVSCFIFSKLMYGIQKRCEELELFVYHVNENYCNKLDINNKVFKYMYNSWIKRLINTMKKAMFFAEIMSDNEMTVKLNIPKEKLKLLVKESLEIAVNKALQEIQNITIMMMLQRLILLNNDEYYEVEEPTEALNEIEVTLLQLENALDQIMHYAKNYNFCDATPDILQPVQSAKNDICDARQSIKHIQNDSDEDIQNGLDEALTCAKDKVNSAKQNLANISQIFEQLHPPEPYRGLSQSCRNTMKDASCNAKASVYVAQEIATELSEFTSESMESEENKFKKLALKYLKERDKHFVKTSVLTLGWFQLWFLFHWVLYMLSTFMILTLLIDAIALHVKARITHIDPGVLFDPAEIGFLFMYSLVQCFFLLYPCLRAASVTRTRARVIRHLNEQAHTFTNIPADVMNEFIDSMRKRKFSFRLRILCAQIPFNLNIAYFSIAFGFVGVVVTLITSVKT